MADAKIGQSLWAEAKSIIPGGCQLYSKRAELYAPEWPPYYDSARGIRVRDLDGKVYQDFSTMGLGACILGYADEDVDTAVLRAISKGSTSSLNCIEEVELAKLLLTIHPWADMCRFTRSGGEAMAVAQRIAQTFNSPRHKHQIITFGYHGWHINDPTKDNDPVDPIHTSVASPHIMERLPDHLLGICAVIIDPIRTKEPEPGFLEWLREQTTRTGAVLIFDEITSGFLHNLGGVHLTFGVTPDIAVFGKALGNGYPIAAVIGKRDIMMAAEDTFISSTHWSERTGFAAATATIHKMWSENVYEHINRIGAAVKAGMPVPVEGRPALLHFDFGSPEQATAYTQHMLQKGYLAGKQFYPSYAHDIAGVNNFLEAANSFTP